MTDRRTKRRRLSEDEHKLWSGITRSVSPLKRKPAISQRNETAPKAEHASPPRPRADAVPPSHTSARKPAAKPASAPAVSLAGLDRREKRRLVRGVDDIEARIDLHGKTQSEAHAALLAFLHRAQGQGARFVLVITGKGGLSAGSSAGRGVLKRQVPLWLRQAEFRAYVLAAEDAHRAHGGEGALYIRLRRATK
jgi:DNA-nicking Smr family endonuclease